MSPDHVRGVPPPPPVRVDGAGVEEDALERLNLLKFVGPWKEKDEQ